MSAYAHRPSQTASAESSSLGSRPEARSHGIAAARIMGVLNVTPDSFSDGGRFMALDAALSAARAMHAQGAAIIDVGGESTRPGAEPVSAADEIARVIPVIEAISAELPVTISIDTSKPEVMQAAVAAGASMINDVTALGAPRAVDVARALEVPVCLMHMRGTPRTMQKRPRYDDVLAEVREYLLRRADACLAVGIDAGDIYIDPGFGFGKTLEHNLTLLGRLDALVATGYPVLVGLSRKSMIAAMLDRPVEQRAAASAALALIAVQKGASVVRVHDVAETADALNVAAWVTRASTSADG